MEERILIIIPAFNEEESILNTYNTILDINLIYSIFKNNKYRL